MTYEQTRLTHLEEVKALTDAKIDPNIDNWDDTTLSRAAEVLDKAQAAKIERLTLHKTPKAPELDQYALTVDV